LKRILVSAGDPSGDQLLSKIIKQIKESSSEPVEFVGLAGPLCENEGVKVIVQAKEVAVVGLVEVLRSLPKIFRAMKRLERELENVDSVLCVDFPDFNLRLAKMAKKKGIPVDYVVAPQVWAWRSSRLKDIAHLVRRLYPALSFEEELFREAGVDAHYMGHPIRDSLEPRNPKAARAELGIAEDEFVMCLMPGSRHGEVRRHLGLLLESWKLLTKNLTIRNSPLKVRALLPLARGWDAQSLEEHVPREQLATFRELIESGEWKLVYQAHLAMMASNFGWITSGTATLEAAYYQLPHILIYKLNTFSVFLLQQLSNYVREDDPMVGLPNILLQRKVIPELLQHNLSAGRLVNDTVEFLENPSQIVMMKKTLRFLPRKLGEPGASRRIADDLGSLWGL